jgi:transposase
LVVQSLQAHLTYLEEELRTLKEAIFAHLEHHAELRAQRELLVSIIGIGQITAAWLLAELPPVGRFPQARQVSAYAGLSPQQHESGQKHPGPARLCKLGSGRLRKALYFPALTALQHDPAIQAWAERLRARGKSKMVIVGAVMRKLLHLAYGVLKTGAPYDPAWESKRAAAV